MYANVNKDFYTAVQKSVKPNLGSIRPILIL